MRDHRGPKRFKRSVAGRRERIPRRAIGGKNNRCGFTLMELMVAIAIICILAAIAIPNAIAWRSNSQFNAAVREVKSAIAGTRMAAIRTDLSANLFFNSTNTFKTQTQEIETAGGVVQATLNPQVSHQLASGITVSANNGGQLTFNNQGMATPATVKIKHANGLCRQIAVDLVGTAQIQACP